VPQLERKLASLALQARRVCERLPEAAIRIVERAVAYANMKDVRKQQGIDVSGKSYKKAVSS
jgi:hypothetical protein